MPIWPAFGLYNGRKVALQSACVTSPPAASAPGSVGGGARKAGQGNGVSLANEHRRLPRTLARSTHLATVGARAKERLERLPRGRDGAKPLRGIIPQRPHSAPRMSARLLVGGPFPHAMHLAEADGVEGLCALGVVASLARRLAVQLVRVANSALDRELAGIPSDLGRPFARQRNIQ